MTPIAPTKRSRLSVRRRSVGSSYAFPSSPRTPCGIRPSTPSPLSLPSPCPPRRTSCRSVQGQTTYRLPLTRRPSRALHCRLLLPPPLPLPLPLGPGRVPRLLRRGAREWRLPLTSLQPLVLSGDAPCDSRVVPENLHPLESVDTAHAKLGFNERVGLLGVRYSSTWMVNRPCALAWRIPQNAYWSGVHGGDQDRCRVAVLALMRLAYSFRRSLLLRSYYSESSFLAVHSSLALT